MHTRDNVNLDINSILKRISVAEEYYNNMPKLKLRSNVTNTDIRVKRNHTAETFVSKFFKEFNKKFNTLIKGTDELDTGIDARRSLGDVYRLAKEYGLKFGLKEIMIEAYKMVENSEIASNYCFQINKRVYKERGQTNGSYYDSSRRDEFGFTKQHYELLKNTK